MAALVVTSGGLGWLAWNEHRVAQKDEALVHVQAAQMRTLQSQTAQLRELQSQVASNHAIATNAQPSGNQSTAAGTRNAARNHAMQARIRKIAAMVIQSVLCGFRMILGKGRES